MLWMIPLFGINVRWDVRVKLVSFKVHSCWHFEIHQIPRDEALKWFDTRFTKSENFSVRYSGTGSVVKLNSYKLTPPPHAHTCHPNCLKFYHRVEVQNGSKPWQVDMKPLKTKSTWSEVRNMRTTFQPFFLKRYQKHVKFIFRICFGTVIYVRFVDTAKVLAEVLEDCRGWRVRCLWFPSSDRLETWLIPSWTTKSRQEQSHGSTMVWRNLPPYHRL